MVDRDKAHALMELRDAVDAYFAYRHSVVAGTALVNAYDDPQDLVDAAMLNIIHRARDCQSLGATADEVGRVVARLTR
jgi:hypothetical protein